MSLKQIVSLTNEEEATYLDIWSMVQRRAQSRISLDVREAMGKHYKLKSLMQGINIGKNLGGNLTNPGGEFIGFTIELIESGTYQFVPSPLASIHVQELNFYSDATVNGQTFVIYDLTTGIQLWTVNVDLVSGWNTIQVNQTFHNNYNANSWRIGCFYFDSGDIGIFKSLETPINHTLPGCCDVRIRGAYGAIAYDPNVTYTSDSYGLSGTFSIVCNWDALMCQNKTLFSRAYWYLLGIEMLTETLYSSKLNQYTTVNLQRAKELREEYQVEYMKALDQVAGGMKLSCDCCIECSEPVQLRETTQFY